MPPPPHWFPYTSSPLSSPPFSRSSTARPYRHHLRIQPRQASPAGLSAVPWKARGACQTYQGVVPGVSAAVVQPARAAPRGTPAAHMRGYPGRDEGNFPPQNIQIYSGCGS